MPFLVVSQYDEREALEQQNDTTTLPLFGRRHLFSAYKDSVIHDSPTLDEHYYHFAEDSAEDRKERNRTQGRKETALFSQFSKQPVELDEKHSRAKNHSLTITDVLGATRRASKLLFQIKDVRDELHILKTIADYQEKVQTSMDKAIHSASNAAFDENMAKYVRNDVDELDRLACNIQEALQTTLTLYETEIANRQAKEAVDQGKRVIIFTVVTVCYLSRFSPAYLH
ncbi:hypothetical protein N0V92_013486 [Colletotrichum tropicale]|nr:hypothetical protein N0V92_013486 [Colletotrichum tropicale]